jgi:hypothetical protein
MDANTYPMTEAECVDLLGVPIGDVTEVEPVTEQGWRPVYATVDGEADVFVGELRPEDAARLEAAIDALPCAVCGGKRYVVAARGGNPDRRAVEACDACSTNQTLGDVEDFTDEDAAKLAQADGIVCRAEYPCFLGTEDDWGDALADYQAQEKSDQAGDGFVWLPGGGSATY